MYARTARAGDRAAPSKALRTLDRMRAAGVQPNVHAYGAAVDACGAAARVLGVEQAVALGTLVLDMMHRSPPPPCRYKSDAHLSPTPAQIGRPSLPRPVQIGRPSLPHPGTNRTHISPPPGTNRTRRRASLSCPPAWRCLARGRASR